MNTGRCLPINSAGALLRELSSGFAVAASTTAAVVPYFLVAFFCLVGQSSGLRLTSMKVPTVADVGEDMEIECHYDMGTEDLYSIKWYKDGKEFFRFIPGQDPNKIAFPTNGVQLESLGTNCTYGHCSLKLRNLTRHHSSGAYKCEISSEAPAFRLASETHNVTVAALPKQKPRIEGLIASYMEGDFLKAKCISDLADPPPILTWYINDEPAPSIYVGGISSSQPDEIGRVSRSLTLHFQLDRKLSKGNNRVEIRCKAALPGVPLPPQEITQSIHVRDPNDPQFSNQQQWYFTFSHANHNNKPLHIAWALISTIAIQWSIEKIFK